MPMIKILKISGAESRINSRTCLGYLVSLQLRAALSSCCDATSSSSWHHSQRRAKTKKIIHRDINTILLNSSESVSYQFSGNGRHLENIVKKIIHMHILPQSWCYELLQSLWDGHVLVPSFLPSVAFRSLHEHGAW